MRTLAQVLMVALAVSLCFVTAAAASEGNKKSSVTIEFYKSSETPQPGEESKPPVNPVDPPEDKPTPNNGGNTSSNTGSSGGTSIADTVRVNSTTIPDSQTPTDFVDIVDSIAPLGSLPKTGGNTVIPMLLIAAGGIVLLAAGQKGAAVAD